MLNRAFSHYEQLWPTMTHYDPQWPKIFTLWPTMTQNVVDCFRMTQNKVLGNFVFLNFIPKILFWGKFSPETWKYLRKMKLNTKGTEGCWFWVQEVFLKSVTKIPFLGKFGLKALKCFVLNETQCERVFRGGCRFCIRQLLSLISSLKYLFWANLVPKFSSDLFGMKLGTKEYSGVLNSFLKFCP